MYYTVVNINGTDYLIYATEQGITGLEISVSEPNNPEDYIKKEPEDAIFATIVDQLKSYLSGKLKEFSLPVLLTGTYFQQDVWEALLNIPYGKVVSYADIAEKIGNPKAIRAVGSAIGKNPIPIIVPCHRVINTSGKLGGYSGCGGGEAGLKYKQFLLDLEKLN